MVGLGAARSPEVGGSPATGSRELGPAGRPGWTLSLYEKAAEAGGCMWMPPRHEPSGRPIDPERAGQEAARRARGMVRRYCAANRLNRLGTLTYAGEGCHDPSELRSHVGSFFKGLRRELGGKPLPYLWVPEWHPGGHGLHVHFAVGRFIKQSLIREEWGRGHVHIKLLSNLPVGSGALEEARLSARYLAPYVSKSAADRREAGRHRYEVAQGFTPKPIHVEGYSADHVIGQASRFMGRQPATVWHSSGEDGWQGPPVCWVAWD